MGMRAGKSLVRTTLSAFRAGMRRLDRIAARLTGYPADAVTQPAPEMTARFETFFRSLPVDADARRYLDIHLRRLIRTMTLAPAPQGSRRVLELGAYLQMTPALESLAEYDEVRAADFGPLGQSVRKSVPLADGEFVIDVDLFDAECDRFPYPDGYFSLILCCEMLEHLLTDPMHMMCEIRRCLEPGGRALFTTPNCASLSSIESVLSGQANPQVFAEYSKSNAGSRPHVREYTAIELGKLLSAGGFEVEQLFTERVSGAHELGWVRELLVTHHFDYALRGEQTYCLARMREDLPVERYPEWLYD